MSPKPQATDFSAPLVSSKEFFERSTRVLEEGDSNYRPQPDMMSVAQQVAHTAQTLNWFVEGASRPEGFDLDFEKAAREIADLTSLEEARRMLDDAFTNAIEFLRSRTADQMATPLPAGPIMGGEPMLAIVGAMVEHTAHHRGALTVYSRMLGKVPPMPYGG